MMVLYSRGEKGEKGEKPTTIPSFITSIHTYVAFKFLLGFESNLLEISPKAFPAIVNLQILL